MKTGRLSEIDLARFAALQSATQLENALRGYDAGGGAWSYAPVRESTCDILGNGTPLFGGAAPVLWHQLSAQITRACKRGSDQIRANTEVGKLMFDTSRTRKWEAAAFPMGRIPIGAGQTLRYWSDVVLGDSAGLFIPFFDHRRDNGLSTSSARRIVFSLQNIWVRDRNPDLATARMAVVRFPVHNDCRQVVIDYHVEEELLSFEDLDARIRNVYETWARVKEQKRRANLPPKTGTGELF